VARPKTYKYITTEMVGGKLYKSPAYSHWRHIIERSSDPYKIKYPTYKDVVVSDSWLDFESFHDDIINFKGYGVKFKDKLCHLDKDLLVRGNKIYCKENCILLPPALNSLLTSCGVRRGDNPVGVSLNQGRYMVTISIDGRNKNLGRYKTPEEAFTIYKIAKEEQIKVLATRWKDEIDLRAYTALMSYEIIDDRGD
jgi:hypothetical protein